MICLILLILFYLFLLLPRYSKKNEWDKLKKYTYAHRGLHDSQKPENTLAAYKAAIDHGYGFEFDVQRTKDDVLVVMHDASLERSCQINRRIDECTYEEIKDLTVFNSNEKIPLFTEVLEMVNGKVPLVIEIKQYGFNTKTCELISELLDKYQGTFCVESFHPAAVFWFKKNRPHWIRGQLSCLHTKEKKNPWIVSFLLEYLLLNVITRPDFVAYDVNGIHNLSFKIYRDILKGATALWTVKDKDTYLKNQKKHDIQIFENFTI